ncbi:MAG: hypothetical protein LUF68_06300 [Clostridiales bacterium]|nr:hypothetical protein [Clostridiales bacterium]
MDKRKKNQLQTQIQGTAGEQHHQQRQDNQRRQQDQCDLCCHAVILLAQLCSFVNDVKLGKGKAFVR